MAAEPVAAAKRSSRGGGEVELSAQGAAPHGEEEGNMRKKIKVENIPDTKWFARILNIKKLSCKNFFRKIDFLPTADPFVTNNCSIYPIRHEVFFPKATQQICPR